MVGVWSTFLPPTHHLSPQAEGLLTQESKDMALIPVLGGLDQIRERQSNGGSGNSFSPASRMCGGGQGSEHSLTSKERREAEGGTSTPRPDPPNKRWSLPPTCLEAEGTRARRFFLDWGSGPIHPPPEGGPEGNFGGHCWGSISGSRDQFRCPKNFGAACRI